MCAEKDWGIGGAISITNRIHPPNPLLLHANYLLKNKYRNFKLEAADDINVTTSQRQNGCFMNKSWKDKNNKS